jgi:hypothetical protein
MTNVGDGRSWTAHLDLNLMPASLPWGLGSHHP